MSSFISGARDRVYEIIDSVWSVNTIFNAETAERINWRDLIAKVEAGGTGLTPPYCVCVWGAQTSVVDTVTADAYNMPVSILYVTSTNSSGTKKNSRVLLTEIEDNLRAFVDALKADTSGAFNVWEFSTDAADSNPANQVFLDSDIAMYAGIVTANLLIGNA